MKRNKRTVFCLLGVDGSGKTTTANGVLQKLRDDGYRCRSLTLDYFFLRLIPTSLRRVANKSLIPVAKMKLAEDKVTIPHKQIKKTSLPLLWVTLLLYLIDSLAAYWFRVKLGSRGNIVIYDRYYYDYVIPYLDTCPRWLWWCYRNLIPKPQAVFLLNIAPEAAEARDKEYPTDFYHSQTQKYLAFTRRVKLNAVVIDNADGVQEATATTIYSRIKQVIREGEDV